MKVLLNDINTLKGVVNICNKYVDDVYAIKDGYVVNAKSLLDLFLLSIDLSQEVELIIDTYRDSVITNFCRDIKNIDTIQM